MFYSRLKIENALLDMISTHYMRRHEDVCNVWYMIQFCRKFAKIGGKKRGDNFPQSRIFLPKTIPLLLAKYLLLYCNAKLPTYLLSSWKCKAGCFEKTKLKVWRERKYLLLNANTVKKIGDGLKEVKTNLRFFGLS